MLEPVRNYINSNYGSKRGLFNHVLFSTQYRLGFFRKLERINWKKVDRLVFVCAGNICRSPLACEYARNLGLNAESFGLTGGDGFPADPRAIEVGRENGIDLTGHVARNIRGYVPSDGDLLVAMEPAHILALESLFRDVGGLQKTLAGLWLGSARPYIHDPFSSNGEFFKKCEGDVMRSIDGLQRRLGW